MADYHDHSEALPTAVSTGEPPMPTIAATTRLVFDCLTAGLVPLHEDSSGGPS